MADVVYTPSNVYSKTVDANRPPTEIKVGAQAINAGSGVRLDPSDSSLVLPCSAATPECVGISLVSAQPNQSILYQYNGSIDYGGGLTQGEVYVVSATTGALAPASDLATGDYTIILGVAESATSLLLNLFVSGVARL